MADKKISALTSAATPVAGTEVLPIVQSSTTKQVSIANLTSGRDVAAKSLTVSGESAYGQGKIFTTGAEGLLLQAKTGSFFDAGLLNAAGNAYAWTVAPGTQNMKLWGEATIGNSGIQNHTVYGNLVMASAGKGIDFSATTQPAAGMTSELLADYEEGTWTPAYGTTGTGFDAITYNAVTAGSYVKVGNVVFIQGYIMTSSFTAGSASGNLVLTGLPYAAAAATTGYGTIGVGDCALFPADTPLSGVVTASGTTIALWYRATVNGATTNMPAATSLQNGGSHNYFSFSGSYRTT
jgi:hypothetical protein